MLRPSERAVRSTAGGNLDRDCHAGFRPRRTCVANHQHTGSTRGRRSEQTSSGWQPNAIAFTSAPRGLYWAAPDYLVSLLFTALRRRHVPPPRSRCDMRHNPRVGGIQRTLSVIHKTFAPRAAAAAPLPSPTCGPSAATFWARRCISVCLSTHRRTGAQRYFRIRGRLQAPVVISHRTFCRVPAWS